MYPVPLSVLVEKYDDQLGEHLVAFFTEWQVPTLKCHIHNVPGGGRHRYIDEYKTYCDMVDEKNQTVLTCTLNSSDIVLVWPSDIYR